MPSVIDERRRWSRRPPAVREPAVHGVELVLPLDPRRAFRPPHFARNAVLVQDDSSSASY